MARHSEESAQVTRLLPPRSHVLGPLGVRRPFLSPARLPLWSSRVHLAAGPLVTRSLHQALAATNCKLHLCHLGVPLLCRHQGLLKGVRVLGTGCRGAKPILGMGPLAAVAGSALV